MNENDFFDELPTLQCGEGGCNSCSAAFKRACAPIVPGREDEVGWDGPTEPNVLPGFMVEENKLDPELGGETG